MRRILCAVICLCLCYRVSAQVQELEQLQLDLEKLAQFKLILSQMKQGYQTLENGYNSVRDASKGNFNLHKNYLDGLLEVRPAVKQSPALQQVGRNQATAVGAFNTAYRQFLVSGVFTNEELIALKSVYSDCAARLRDDQDMLAFIIQPGSLRMNDAERLQAISTIQADVAAQAAVIQHRLSDYSKLLALRKQQGQDFNTVKRWSGIK